MVTIRITDNDLRNMISEAVSRLWEAQWYQAETLCYSPYYVSCRFSDHAIDREFERDITEEEVIEDAKMAVKEIIRDYGAGIISPGERVKIINKDSCCVSVCMVNAGYGKKRVGSLDIITSYIWDGRVNIDSGKNYYVGEESPEYIKAEIWNRDNQDLVVSYMDWKHNRDVWKQRREAERQLYYRTHPQGKSSEKVLKRLDYLYGKRDKEENEKIYDSLPEGDPQAIQRYLRDMYHKPLTSKHSTNRYLRAQDLLQRRKDGRDAQGYGLKQLGKIDLSKVDPKGMNKKRI